jgi:hypothetical protein
MKLASTLPGRYSQVHHQHSHKSDLVRGNDTSLRFTILVHNVPLLQPKAKEFLFERDCRVEEVLVSGVVFQFREHAC